MMIRIKVIFSISMTKILKAITLKTKNCYNEKNYKKKISISKIISLPLFKGNKVKTSRLMELHG